MSSDSVAHDQMLASAALISASHFRANPLAFDLRGHPSNVPTMWGSYKVEAGPPFEPRRHGEVSRSEATYWLAVCSALTGPARDGRDSFLRKGWSHACRLTGLIWLYVTKAIYDARFFGTESAGSAWALYMRRPDERCIGEIYIAHAAGEPNVVKVGFSTQVSKRMAALSRAEGRSIVVERTFPGTLLHEWALHAQIPGAIKPEWYPRENLPSWLLAEAA